MKSIITLIVLKLFFLSVMDSQFKFNNPPFENLNKTCFRSMQNFILLNNNIQQDSTDFSYSNGFMYSYIDGVSDSVDARDSILIYFDRIPNENEITCSTIITNMPHYGKGCCFVFEKIAIAYFPQSDNNYIIRIVNSPGDVPFFIGRQFHYVFKDGTILLLNPYGYAGFRHNFRFSQLFIHSETQSVPQLINPILHAVESDTLDAVDIFDEQTMGKGVRRRIMSGEQIEGKKIHSGIFLEIITDK